MGRFSRTEDDTSLTKFDVPFLPRWILLMAHSYGVHSGCRGRTGALDSVSIQAINWAFQQPVETSTCKFILVCLANYANESRECYPSITTISDMTSLNRKTIICGLDKLIKDGYIADSGKRVGNTKQIPVYKLNSPENGTVPKTDGKSPIFTIKQSRFYAKQSLKRDTDPLGTVKEPSEGKRPPVKFVSELKEQVRLATERIDKLRDKGSPLDHEEIRLLIAKRKQWNDEILSL